MFNASKLLAQGAGVLFVEPRNHSHTKLTGPESTVVDYRLQRNLLFCSNVQYYNKIHIYRYLRFDQIKGFGRSIYVEFLNEEVKPQKCVQPLNSEISYAITAGGSWAPTGLAIDWVSDKLYVAEQVGRKVDVFELDGNRRAVILSFNLSSPIDVALDPRAGLMFIGDVDQIVYPLSLSSISS